jgi:hypothetical protein
MQHERTVVVRRAFALLLWWIMPTIDLDDAELAAVKAALREKIAGDKFPLSPRLKPYKAALAKLDPSSAPEPREPKPPLPEAPMRSRGGKRARR